MLSGRPAEDDRDDIVGGCAAWGGGGGAWLVLADSRCIAERRQQFALTTVRSRSE